jgi:thioredoxin reductase
MPTATDLLVIGAGPYALATAGLARAQGLDTAVLGRPMGFWREHMPAEMFLRSGPDWHLDALGEHTLEAYLEERGIAPAEVDPLPIALFLDYADWYRRAAGVEVREERVTGLAREDGGFEATLDGGERIRARCVLCAPGVRHYAVRPDWAASLPDAVALHTCDLVRFADVRGARVAIIGGRQSAYEWAAILCDHGAERVDVVHRHAVPRFAKVSWAFVDAHVERTLAQPGYWRRLPAAEREAIARRFWEVGRLTLEAWLTPRLRAGVVRRRPGVEVVEAAAAAGGVRLRLSSGESLDADRVVLACGYKADLRRVPYLRDVLADVALEDGFPVLDEHFQTTLPGLYVTGFSATRDFGPFFGFVKGAPAAAALTIDGVLSASAAAGDRL